MKPAPEQRRIQQLTSTYGPAQPPQLPLEFSDYLSLLWRIDRAAGQRSRASYYRQCASALARALDFEQRSLGQYVRVATPGQVCSGLEGVPYRATTRLVDAQDRRAALRQLLDLRNNILVMAAYRESWSVGWPGSRLDDEQLRERLFAVFFTAFEGQFQPFSRLLLVIDVVLQELLLGTRDAAQVSLIRLIHDYGYPDPLSAAVQQRFAEEQPAR